MKKTSFFLIATLIVCMLAACGGKKKVHEFAENFAEYVTSGDMDSVRAIYPTATFDSLAKVPTDSIEITETDGTYKINYGANQWIEVKEGEDGTLTVVNSKGIARFPADKYRLAVGTGMMDASADDQKAKEMLNDSTYFDWLSKNYDNGDYVIQITPGKVKYISKWSWGEAWKGSITVTLKNMTDQPISGEDYTIAYKTRESNGCTDNSQRWYTKSYVTDGKDLAPKGTETITLSRWVTDKYSDFKVVPAAGKESKLKYEYKPTGKEYQEYLDSKK